MLFLAAAILFFASATFYYHGRFVLSGLTGIAYWVAMGWLVAGAMGPVGASFALVLLAGLPAASLVVHIVDARRGIFLLPTVYAIPLAFAAGLVLLAVGGLALVIG